MRDDLLALADRQFTALDAEGREDRGDRFRGRAVCPEHVLEGFAVADLDQLFALGDASQSGGASATFVTFSGIMRTSIEANGALG